MELSKREYEQFRESDNSASISGRRRTDSLSRQAPLAASVRDQHTVRPGERCGSSSSKCQDGEEQQLQVALRLSRNEAFLRSARVEEALLAQAIERSLREQNADSVEVISGDDEVARACARSLQEFRHIS